MRAVEGAVIAAAGLGSRLGLGLPKCMLEIGGETILSRIIHSLQKHVERIHVVVGYREELVIEHCAREHRDVVLVRNPDFRTTNTAFSMTRGANGLAGKKVLFLDGDLLISEPSLAGFIKRASECDILLGVTKAKSEQAVFVDVTVGDNSRITVNGFTREGRHSHEWANIVAGPADLVSDASGFVYESLAAHLPLPGQSLDLCEIDTAADMKLAKEFIQCQVMSEPSR